MGLFSGESQGGGENKEFEAPSEGKHVARLVGLAFTGTIDDTYQGNQTLKRRLLATFEIVDELRSDGKPFLLTKNYNVSASKFGSGFYAAKTSGLFKDLKSWLKPILGEKEPSSLHWLENALEEARPAGLMIEHTDKGKPKIVSIKPVASAPAHVSKPWTWKVGVGMEKPVDMPEWIIKSAQESFEVKGWPESTASAPPPKPQESGNDLNDEDVPF